MAEILPGAAERAFRRRGFTRARVITDWADIVGEDLARHCRPLSIARGVLTVLVTPSHAPVVQHLEPVILERIATFYGSADGEVVGRLRLKQGHVAQEPVPQRRTVPPLTAAQAAYLDRLLGTVDDPRLKKALYNLGAAVLGQDRGGGSGGGT